MALPAKSTMSGTLFIDLYKGGMGLTERPPRRGGPSAEPQSPSHVTWYLRVSLPTRTREVPTSVISIFNVSCKWAIMAHIVYSGAAQPAEGNNGIFAGIQFWVSHNVPQRSRFVDDVKVQRSFVSGVLERRADQTQSNGGRISQLEKQADVMIVDHARKYQVPGSYALTPLLLKYGRTLTRIPRYSYTFIEASVRKGVLEDLEDHAVGPPKGAVRTTGSMQPAKATRTQYTSADDNILWDWVQTNPQKFGGTDGNEIYKQLQKKVRSLIPNSSDLGSMSVASTPPVAVMERPVHQTFEREASAVCRASQCTCEPVVRNGRSTPADARSLREAYPFHQAG